MESMLICGNMFINHIMWAIQSIYAHIDGKKYVHVQFQGSGINLEPWKLLKLKVCFCFFCQIFKSTLKILKLKREVRMWYSQNRTWRALKETKEKQN